MISAGMSTMPNPVPVHFQSFFALFPEFFFGVHEKRLQQDEIIFVRIY